jgi:hypothetical protein
MTQAGFQRKLLNSFTEETGIIVSPFRVLIISSKKFKFRWNPVTHLTIALFPQPGAVVDAATTRLFNLVSLEDLRC